MPAPRTVKSAERNAVHSEVTFRAETPLPYIGTKEDELCATLAHGTLAERIAAAADPDATELVLSSALADPAVAVRWAAAHNPSDRKSVV